MAESTTKNLRVMVVTPERAVLDESTSMVVLPLFDGEIGIQPGHAAFVGELGPGEMRIGAGSTAKRYFIDGGFAQVQNSLVNVLTGKATAAADITTASAATALAAAEALPKTNSAEQATREKAIARAQGMARMAAKV
ncbi:MAG: ATP synthase F1 subunit epsilon [Gemmataceae bacterium]